MDRDEMLEMILSDIEPIATLRSANCVPISVIPSLVSVGAMVCTLCDACDGDSSKPGGNSQLHGGKNLARLASANEMFVAAVRFGLAWLSIGVGGGGLSKSDLVVEVIDGSTTRTRYLLANSEMGVDGESTTL